MGGNSRLGYTLINQRAQEVNKAVLELCDNIFLHRQKGRNSLTALDKRLDIGNVKDKRAITETLATLPTGECWAWPEGTDQPERIKVQAKNSLRFAGSLASASFPTSTRLPFISFTKAPTSTGLTLAAFASRMTVLSELRKQIAELQKQAKAGGVRLVEKARQEGHVAGYAEGYREGRLDFVGDLNSLIAKVSGAHKAKPSIKTVMAAKPPIVVPPRNPFKLSARTSAARSRKSRAR